MKTKALNKCFRVFNCLDNKDESVILELNDLDIQFYEYSSPFQKELVKNLLMKETTESKTDVIKYYINKFYSIQGFYQDYIEILFENDRSYNGNEIISHQPKENVVIEGFEKIVVISHDFLVSLFNSIQHICLIYNVDFFKACKEARFDPNVIDTTLTTTLKKPELIDEYIKPFNGYLNGVKILNKTEYDQLQNDVLYLIENEKIPAKISKIQPKNISAEFIRKTFEQLHKQLYGRRKRLYWIDFLHKKFIQFEEWESETTNKNFTSYRGDFEKDQKRITN